MGKAADELVDVIRDIIIREMEKRDSTTLCQVVNKKDDNKHFDVCVVPDNSTRIMNVINPTALNIEVGDFVYIYKINNQLNNSFIVSKIMPYADHKIGTGRNSIVKESSNFFTPLGLVYEEETNTWWYNLSEEEYKIINNSNVTKIKATIGCATPGHTKGTFQQIMRIPVRKAAEYHPLGCTAKLSKVTAIEYPLQNFLLKGETRYDVTEIVNNFIFHYNKRYMKHKINKNANLVGDGSGPFVTYGTHGTWYKEFKVDIFLSEGRRTRCLDDNKTMIKVYYDYWNESDMTGGKIQTDRLQTENAIYIVEQ